MAEWRERIAFDPDSGMETNMFKEGGQIYLQHTSSYSALVEENKRLNTQPQKSKTMRLVARTPAQFEYIDWPREFQQRHGVHPHRHNGPDRREVRRQWKRFKTAKLNSPDFAYLRVDDGRKL